MEYANYNEDTILQNLKTLITAERLKHSLGVRDLAEILARSCGVDPAKARIAGLLHDCARDMSREEMLHLACQGGMEVGAEEMKRPVLLHAGVGALVARERFGISSPDILQAIKLHTTGAEGMTLLDKIIYLADKLEGGRDYAAVDKIREMSLMDINEGMKASLFSSINYLLKADQMIHPDTIKAWNELIG